MIGVNISEPVIVPESDCRIPLLPIESGKASKRIANVTPFFAFHISIPDFDHFNPFSFAVAEVSGIEELAEGLGVIPAFYFIGVIRCVLAPVIGLCNTKPAGAFVSRR